MLVISNHVKKLGMDFPKDAVVRINVAWVKSLEELEKIISDNLDNEIWVDYPTGRTKPPVPTLSIAESISVLSKYSNIAYFAFSNAEDTNIIQLIRQAVPKNIKLVPKIETTRGVNNLENIVKASETDTIMFDAEDLYTNVKNDINTFSDYSKCLKNKCISNNIKLLRLQGVIFSDV